MIFLWEDTSLSITILFIFTRISVIIFAAFQRKYTDHNSKLTVFQEPVSIFALELYFFFFHNNCTNDSEGDICNMGMCRSFIKHNQNCV